MLYCTRCKKEVVIYGVNSGTINEEQVEKSRRDMESKGKIILFNPPSFESYKCPICNKPLKEC